MLISSFAQRTKIGISVILSLGIVFSFLCIRVVGYGDSITSITQQPIKFIAEFTVVSLIICSWLMAVFYILSYPHIGWRRIYIAVGCLSMAVYLLQYNYRNYWWYWSVDDTLFLMIYSVGPPILLLLSGKLLRWIHDGFKRGSEYD
ncbi:MAG: hypothetical protein HQM04_18135 [Magnetococcales bacterium]|nr:hypothetical protein [Magnetococcales bacterium]MBF0116947.1 hypothetical protein [Magnetococcales bacterium]